MPPPWCHRSTERDFLSSPPTSHQSSRTPRPNDSCGSREINSALRKFHKAGQSHILQNLAATRPVAAQLLVNLPSHQNELSVAVASGRVGSLTRSNENLAASPQTQTGSEPAPTMSPSPPPENTRPALHRALSHLPELGGSPPASEGVASVNSSQSPFAAVAPTAVA